MSAYNGSRNQYIKECFYYEDSAFTLTGIFVADTEKNIRNKEGKEEKINSLYNVC